MKKILLLFIASSLSLFATIDGHDENLIIKAVEQSKKRLNDEISLTDIYVEENKTTPKGGKYIVLEFTLEQEVDKQVYKQLFNNMGKKDLSSCFMIGDKQDNIIISKYRQYGKVIAEIKVDAKEGNAAEK